MLLAINIKTIDILNNPIERFELIGGFHKQPVPRKLYAGVYGDFQGVSCVVVERTPDEGTVVLEELFIKKVDFSTIKDSLGELFKKHNISKSKVVSGIKPLAVLIPKKPEEVELNIGAGIFTLNCLINEESICFEKEIAKTFRRDIEEFTDPEVATHRMKALFLALDNFNYSKRYVPFNGQRMGQSRPVGVAP